jgi:hypothetical protein
MKEEVYKDSFNYRIFYPSKAQPETVPPLHGHNSPQIISAGISLLYKNVLLIAQKLFLALKRFFLQNKWKDLLSLPIKEKNCSIHYLNSYCS